MQHASLHTHTRLATRLSTPPGSTPYRAPYRTPHCYKAGTDLFFEEAARLAELQRALSEAIHMYIQSAWLYSLLTASYHLTRWA